MRRYRTYSSYFTWRLLELLERTGLARHLAFSLSIRIMGHRVRVPIREGVGREFLLVGEPWAHHLFAPLLKAFPGCFVDVGVNLGQTMTLVRLAEPDRTYVGFEPNPVCMAYARDLARVNGFREVPVLPFGVGERDEVVQLEMHSADPADPGATVVAGFRPALSVHQRVPVLLLSFTTAGRLHPTGPIGFLKIDVEGSEREVLRSFAGRIRHDRPAVLLEVLPSGLPPIADRLERQVDIEAFFRDLDYVLVRIHNRPDRIVLEPLQAPIGAHADQELANLIALPAGRFAEVMPALQASLPQR